MYSYLCFRHRSPYLGDLPAACWQGIGIPFLQPKQDLFVFRRMSPSAPRFAYTGTMYIYIYNTNNKVQGFRVLEFRVYGCRSGND